jgi:hypothetical protein
VPASGPLSQLPPLTGRATYGIPVTETESPAENNDFPTDSKQAKEVCARPCPAASGSETPTPTPVGRGSSADVRHVSSTFASTLFCAFGPGATAVNAIAKSSDPLAIIDQTR